MTLGEIKASVLRWYKEDVNDDLLTEAIQDGISDLWEALVLVSLGELLGSPVTCSFEPGSTTASIVSVADPGTPPSINMLVQGALPPRRAHVQYTLATDSGSETMPTPPVPVDVAGEGRLISVGYPGGDHGDAIGWNCYVNGVRQNEVPVAWSVPVVEPEQGWATDGDMAPRSNTTADDVWFIQSMTVKLENGGEKSWEETEIGSALWKRFGMTTASNTPHQAYVYDFLGERVEVRPVTAGSISANMFFVKRPRNMRYDSSIVPFKHPGATDYLRYNALSLLCLSDHEYMANQAWDKEAKGKLQSIIISSNRKNAKRNTSVKPFIRG